MRIFNKYALIKDIFVWYNMKVTLQSANKNSARIIKAINSKARYLDYRSRQMNAVRVRGSTSASDGVGAGRFFKFNKLKIKKKLKI